MNQATTPAGVGSTIPSAVQSAVRQYEFNMLVLAVSAIIGFCRVRKDFTSYIDIAKVVGVFSGGDVLARILGKIAEADYKAGRPISTALVIRKDTGMPGDGFFSHMTSLGATVGTTLADHKKYWQAQVDALFA
jgi:hypothetical protein